MKSSRPRPDEYDAAFERYVSRVPETDILSALERQPAEFAAALASVPSEREGHRYAPGKWSIREVVGHMLDAEHVMGYRALAISRGDKASLPGFEQNDYAANAGSDRRTLASLAAEFTSLRASHVLMLRHVDDAGWVRVGTANGLPITPRALAYVLVGHVRHHIAVLREKYGVGV
ncbi:MAG: DinB family protein [Thermoanaerobaculia bacterium]